MHYIAAEMKQWDPVKTLKKKWLVALLNPFLSVVIKPKKCHKWWGKKPKKPAKCLSKGQPNVNLLTFASAKHKPTTECVAQWMSHYKRGFHMICSVLDGSLLCYFDLNSQVFSVIRKPAQHQLPRFLSKAAMQQLGDVKTLAKLASYITLSVFYWQAAFQWECCWWQTDEDSE